MIKNDSTKGGSLKEIREREKQQKDAELRTKCEQRAIEMFSAEQIGKWAKENNGVWYLPVLDKDGNIEAMAVLKPISRHILSYASTKLTEEGLYAFLEQCMRECWIAGDDCILEDDEFFIPSAMQFNSIMEGKKASLLKR